MSWHIVFSIGNLSRGHFFDLLQVSEELQGRGAEGLCDPLAGTGLGVQIW